MAAVMQEPRQSFWAMIFKPRDGRRERMEAAVAQSKQKVEQAANRFELTIRELLIDNDRVTGRNDAQR